jgi:adenylate kinase
MPLNVLLLGPQGAGKGTQAKRIAAEYDIPHISSGEILRAEMQAGTALGLRVKDVYDRGDLVSDDLMIELIKTRLAQPDTEGGFILDGFPRTLGQAEALDRLLKDLGQTLDGVLYFRVPELELVRRLSGRRICRQCQTAYHVVSAPPARPGVCDRCGGDLYQRDDDSETTVRTRLQVYERQTVPLLEYYGDRGLLATIDGEGSIDAIRDTIRRAATEAR